MNRGRQRLVRLLRPAAFCVLLGVATTFAIAWAFHAFNSFRTSDPDRRHVYRIARPGQPVPARPYLEFEAVGAVWEIWDSPRGFRIVVLRGWPWPAACSEGEVDLLGRWIKGEPAGFRWMPWDQFDIPFWQPLPLRPLWPGFALDTALYAGVWALAFVPGAVCRRLRALKGRCIRCAYDLKGTPAPAPCPECGHAQETD